MSASLFDCVGVPYESYPKTEYVAGDKRFGEVGIGGILYCLDRYNKLSELEVTNPFHVAKGRCYITIKGRGKNIDFGIHNCANVLESRDMSIVFYNDCIIGTNKESVINTKCNTIENKIAEAKTMCKFLERQLKDIKSL